MQLSRVDMGFSEKKVSKNAIFSAALGGTLLVIHIIMIVLSVVKKGTLPMAGGLVESFALLFSVFGLLWAVLSYDEEKTIDKYKALGIILNGIALLIAIFVMAVGFMSYDI